MAKKILITGGHTQIPIDQVRVISNIFKGRTACEIANEFWRSTPFHEQAITVIGNQEMESKLDFNDYFFTRAHFIPYKSYNDLYSLMEREVTTGNYDVIIHSSAVSDYYVSGVLAEPGGEYLDASKKVSSSHDTLYLELKKTRKIVDDIRNLWGFKGTLIKFKLQVGLDDEELLEIARKSRVESKADFIVANCLEWAKEKAYIVGGTREYLVSREDLGKALYMEVYSE